MSGTTMSFPPWYLNLILARLGHPGYDLNAVMRNYQTESDPIFEHPSCLPFEPSFPSQPCYPQIS
jgi:hypothetical protein